MNAASFITYQGYSMRTRLSVFAPENLNRNTLDLPYFGLLRKSLSVEAAKYLIGLFKEF